MPEPCPLCGHPVPITPLRARQIVRHRHLFQAALMMARAFRGIPVSDEEVRRFDAIVEREAEKLVDEEDPHADRR